ncbi:hypothetical protein ABDB91_14720 [Desulfoscipio sp. XC116]
MQMESKEINILTARLEKALTSKPDIFRNCCFSSSGYFSMA